MEFGQIKYFVTLAEYKNFTRAANALFVSQPTLSQQIGKLEKELGVLLFNRTNRNVQLTPAGKAFLTKAQELLKLYEDCRLSVGPFCSGQSGQLSIMTLNSVEITFFPQFYAFFNQKYPQINMQHLTGSIKNMMTCVINQSVDLAISILFKNSIPKDIIAKNFNRDWLVLVLAKDSPYSDIRSFGNPNIGALLSTDALLWSDLDNKNIIEFLSGYNNHLKYIYYDDPLVILTRVLGNMGFTVIPETYLDSFNIEFHKIPFPDSIGQLDTSIIYHAKNTNPCVKLFLREALDFLEK